MTRTTREREKLGFAIADAILVDALKFALVPVKVKPRDMKGWGSKRFKKPDPWNFKGPYRVTQHEC
jgi:hypothetical protein